MRSLILLILLILPALVHAADTMNPEDGQWKGKGTLGFTSASGNTDSENLNAALQTSYEKLRWKHNLSFEAVRDETDREISADRVAARARSEYSLTKQTYSFGQARYEEDKFSGFDYQGTVVLGLGSRFIDDGTHFLDLSGGAGYRRLRESETGDTDEGPILTSDLVYEYRISDSATLSEIALVEVGGDNTFLQSETALLMKINSRLSSKISYLVRHNTDVSDDVEKTDETVSFSLVYDF